MVVMWVANVICLQPFYKLDHVMIGSISMSGNTDNSHQKEVKQLKATLSVLI